MELSVWLLALGAATVLLYLVSVKPGGRLSLPPGPPTWPIVGSLFYLSSLPHRSMETLAKKYGPIMFMRLGYLNHLVVSNAGMAREILKVHDAEFASRPHSTAGKYVGFDYKDIIFSPYGDHWRLLRKICTTELLTSARLSTFKAGRHDEVAKMVQSITERGRDGELVKMRPILHMLTSNNICRMLFGRRREATDNLIGSVFDQFFDCVSEMVETVGKFNVGDLIPALKPFDLQGIEGHMKRVSKDMETLLARIIREHREMRAQRNVNAKEDEVKLFLDVLLDLDEELEDKSIMAVMVDMLGGGTDTSATTMEWALSELVHHPAIMKRVQEELDVVVGRDRPVREADLPNLHYLQAVIKENFRLHPAVPLTIPHVNPTAAQLQGYDIPANTNVLVSIWAVGRDPATWENPLEFNPDRFLNSDRGVTGTHYEILPFGSGRRGCPGMNLAQLMVQCGLAALLHAFDWSPAPGIKPEDMSMLESFGGACPIAEPLLVVAKPRVSTDVYKTSA
uniref:Pimaradiene oxidase 1 n=1 Tax=Calohypnum plumiforme TaxID=98943 RepID=A0A6F8PFQ4_9BRYO|nr:pimaradiene oxidase 1 [Calohypnum plumiforme]